MAHYQLTLRFVNSKRHMVDRWLADPLICFIMMNRPYLAALTIAAGRVVITAEQTKDLEYTLRRSAAALDCWLVVRCGCSSVAPVAPVAHQSGCHAARMAIRCR